VGTLKNTKFGIDQALGMQCEYEFFFAWGFRFTPAGIFCRMGLPEGGAEHEGHHGEEKQDAFFLLI